MVDDADELCARVGRRIGELRERAGITQRQAAEQAGIEVANYQRIENGSQNLTLRTMAAIAAVFELPVTALFEEPTDTVKKRSRGRPKKAV